MRKLFIAALIVSSLTPVAAAAQSARAQCMRNCRNTHSLCVRASTNRQQTAECNRAYRQCVATCH
jgi:hypothetical protein